ncbi:MAG: ribonuclease P protein component [Bergeyella sp.]
MNNKYPKAEKLKQKKEISLLFEKGKWRTSGKLRIIFYAFPQDESVSESQNPKAGVSVSKRFFKKAVDRNRIKRLLRESYRLNKDAFAEKFGKNILAMIFWNSPEKPQHYKDVEEEFLKLCHSKK